MEQARFEHAPNGSLLTYITDPLEANKRQEICIFQYDSAQEHTE